MASSSALMATGMISLAPNLILILFPGAAENNSEGRPSSSTFFLSLGQSCAVGGLLGDVFLHSIPHAAHQKDAGLWMILGFSLFLIADIVIRQLEQARGGTSTHSHNKQEASEQQHHANSIEERHHSSIKMSTVVLNLVADALHNFTDGLAIGATYSAGGTRGGLASISILLHEIPHELGDFCTLRKAGFSKMQAIMAQFCTAIAAFMGTCLALYLSTGGDGHNDHRLVLVTAGGFVYLAATSILPEVLEEKSTWSLRFWQLVAFLTGIGFLYMVALLEEHDEHGEHHDHHRHLHHDEHLQKHDDHHDHHVHHEHRDHYVHHDHQDHHMDHAHHHSGDEL